MVWSGSVCIVILIIILRARIGLCLLPLLPCSSCSACSLVLLSRCFCRSGCFVRLSLSLSRFSAQSVLCLSYSLSLSHWLVVGGLASLLGSSCTSVPCCCVGLAVGLSSGYVSALVLGFSCTRLTLSSSLCLAHVVLVVPAFVRSCVRICLASSFCLLLLVSRLSLLAVLLLFWVLLCQSYAFSVGSWFCWCCCTCSVVVLYSLLQKH